MVTIMVTIKELYSFCGMLISTLWSWTFIWTFIFVHFQKPRSTFSHAFSRF